MPILSPSLSLAQLHGDGDTADALQILFESIRKEAAVSGASEPIETAWASLGEKAKSRIRLAFDASRWQIVVPFPLIDKEAFDQGSGSVFEGKSRAKMLEGYGNALIAPQVIAFIEAYLETERELNL